MNEKQRFDKLIARRPHPHFGFYNRPHLSRRQFFRSAGAGLGGFYLLDRILGGEPAKAAEVETKNTAKNCIFLFLAGAPSHVDTFDFKEYPGVTPADFAPETISGLRFPTGLMPNTARVLDRVAIVRSGLSWALAHPLAQTWVQIGRNPTSALGRIAPHIGSVIAIEKEAERRPDQIFPSFIAFNAGGTPGAGYFSQHYAPFKTSPDPEGLANTAHAPGQQRFESRWELLNAMDGNLRSANSPYGAEPAAMGKLYDGARDLMFNPVVTQAFSYAPEESERYGSTAFGDACLLAGKILKADQGTRFIQVTLGGWDQHQDIYDPAANNSIYGTTRILDPAYAALIEDLESAGLLDETLIVLCGEFGRTVGSLSNVRNGRDHYLQMFYALAGGGVQGGKAIGATNDEVIGSIQPGSFTVEPGWSRNRDIRPEDMEATIYSAMGVNWTTVRRDDPLGRGFYYVPLSDDDAYAPVHELWEA
ncbi:MAG: DUF1501 domain-containing protein [Bryobacterales bacterium]